jgi:hypothetical protein
MMVVMNPPCQVWLICAGAVLGGCVQPVSPGASPARERRETREKGPEVRLGRASESPGAGALDAPLPPPSRPRLSRTITLGQGEPTYTDGRARDPAPYGGPSVVVNNQVFVQPSPSLFYGGYGYGYGGYVYGDGGYRQPTGSGGRGGRFGQGSGGAGASGAGGAPHAPSGWSATGWEGAQRTAAPGQTPAVGGNWAPVPDVGPRPMR